MLVKKYESDIKDLKLELAMHDALANRGHIHYEPFTEEQRFELQLLVRKYLSGEVEDLEVKRISLVTSLKKLRLRVSGKSKRSLVNSRSSCRIPTLTQTHERTMQRVNLALQAEMFSSQRWVFVMSFSNNVEQSRVTDDDGVGELEGNGFGVGLVSLSGGCPY